MSMETLYSATSYTSSNMTLSQPYTNYDALLIVTKDDYSNLGEFTQIWPVSMLSKTNYGLSCGPTVAGNGWHYAWAFRVVSTTALAMCTAAGNVDTREYHRTDTGYIIRIYGLKSAHLKSIN